MTTTGLSPNPSDSPRPGGNGRDEADPTSRVIGTFVESLRTGEWSNMRTYYAPDVLFVASVPHWYFTLLGDGEAVAQLEKWFSGTAEPYMLNITPAADGVLVEFERREIDGMYDQTTVYLRGARQMHHIRLKDGRITEQRVYCGGSLDAETLAEIDARALQPYEL